jgi:hypothetical protein
VSSTSKEQAARRTMSSAEHDEHRMLSKRSRDPGLAGRLDELGSCFDGTFDQFDSRPGMQKPREVGDTCITICRAKKDACDVLHSVGTSLGYESDCEHHYSLCRHSCSHYGDDKKQMLARGDEVACLHVCQAKENTCNTLKPPKKNCAQQAWACRHGCTSHEAQGPKALVAREDQVACLHICQAKMNTCSTVHPTGKHCGQQHWACRQNCNQKMEESKALTIREDQAACFHKCESAKNTCDTIPPLQARPNCELKRATCRKACTLASSALRQEINGKSTNVHADSPNCVKECNAVFSGCEEAFGAGTKMCRDNREVCQSSCKSRKQVALKVVSTFVTQVSKRASGTPVSASPAVTLPTDKLGCAAECKLAEDGCLYMVKDELRCSLARTICDTRCFHSNSAVANLGSNNPATAMSTRSLAETDQNFGPTAMELTPKQKNCLEGCQSDGLCILKCLNQRTLHERNEASNATGPGSNVPVYGLQDCYDRCSAEQQRCILYTHAGAQYCAQVQSHCTNICRGFPWPNSKRDTPISSTTVSSSRGVNPALLPWPGATNPDLKMRACFNDCHVKQQQCVADGSLFWQVCYQKERYCTDLCLTQLSTLAERDVPTNITTTFPDDVVHAMTDGPEITPAPVSALSAQYSIKGKGPWDWVPFLFFTEEK